MCEAVTAAVAGRARREAAAHHGRHPAGERGDAADLREARLPAGARLPRGAGQGEYRAAVISSWTLSLLAPGTREIKLPNLVGKMACRSIVKFNEPISHAEEELRRFRISPQFE